MVGAVDDKTNTPQETDEPTGGGARPRMINISGKTIWQAIGAVVATGVVLWMLGQASHLLALVAMSFFFSLALQPAVIRLVHRFGWRRGSAVGVIYAVLLLGTVLLILIIIPAAVTLADAIAENGSEWVNNAAGWLNETFGWEWPEGGFDDDFSTELEDEMKAWLTGSIGNIFGIASTGIGLIFDMATMAMFTFYFTADAPRLQRTVLGLLDPEQQMRIGWTWDQAIVQTGGYFYSRIILMVINGAGFFFTMVLVGMPVALSLPLAIFGGFVAAFIPAIGTYLGSAVPIVMTLAIQGWFGALMVLAYALVYQQIENYWLSPKISSQTMTLNGAVAFGGALAGGAMFGPMGAFVALPVAALITAFVSNFAKHSEVVYEFEYDAHVSAARESAEEAHRNAEEES